MDNTDKNNNDKSGIVNSEIEIIPKSNFGEKLNRTFFEDNENAEKLTPACKEVFDTDITLTLFKEVEEIISILKCRQGILEVDPNEVFADLEQLGTNENRKQLVVDKWLKLGIGDVKVETCTQIESMRDNDVIILPHGEEIQSERPRAGEDVERNDIVISKPQTDAQLTVYQKLMKEANFIKTIVPTKSVEEIYAYLEAFHCNPDRVNIVIRELTGQEDFPIAVKIDPQLPLDKRKDELHIDLTQVGDDKSPEKVFNSKESKSVLDFEAQTTLNKTQKLSQFTSTHDIDLEPNDQINLAEVQHREPQPSTSGQNANQIESEEECHKTLCELFPDADPVHLWQVVTQTYGNAEAFNSTVAKMLEKRDYPKISDVQKAATKRKFQDRNFSIEELLQSFENPEAYFSNTKRPVSSNYKLHVSTHVYNTFPFAYKVDVIRVLEKYNYHLTPILEEMHESYNDGPNVPFNKRVKRSTTVRKKQKATPKHVMPPQADELFYKELAYFEMKDKIKEYKENKVRDRKLKIEAALKEDSLMTCTCCFEEELLIEDMLPCADGHLFCKDCIKRSAEVNIGLSKFKFPCLNPYCEHEFPLIALQTVLKASIFSNLIRKLQEEEIRKADIPDLVSCPYCSFCAIMPDPNNKVFKCLNPECFKETCRLCKQENHVPLRCDEIEGRSEQKMRTFIENKMTEALLRTCPNCGRRFIKEYGCNKMTCACGKSMCYVCREPITSYKHFEAGKCPQYSNDDELHRLEVQTGAEKARDDYVKEHPELKDLHLRHDPTKDIPTTAVKPGLRPEFVNPHAAIPYLNNGEIAFRRQAVPRAPHRVEIARNMVPGYPVVNANNPVAPGHIHLVNRFPPPPPAHQFARPANPHAAQIGPDRNAQANILNGNQRRVPPVNNFLMDANPIVVPDHHRYYRALNRARPPPIITIIDGVSVNPTTSTSTTTATNMPPRFQTLEQMINFALRDFKTEK